MVELLRGCGGGGGGGSRGTEINPRLRGIGGLGRRETGIAPIRRSRSGLGEELGILARQAVLGTRIVDGLPGARLVEEISDVARAGCEMRRGVGSGASSRT